MKPETGTPADRERTVLESGPPSADTLPPVESLGAWTPSRPATLPPLPPPKPIEALSLEPGGRVGEFVVERVLGRGGFGVVYLARQLSLDRQVALKVVPLAGGAAVDGEARSLARLEHDHIVQVYSEISEPAAGARLLCMQYVAGTTLAAVIRAVKQKQWPRDGWSGADLLAILDAIDLPPVLFDPAAMRDRDYLLGADHVEAVCRIGEQLAAALSHAHGRGVLHRDIKPANILVNRYGRPFLADFNLATRETDHERSSVVGGTLAYMPPEHLDAFNPDSPTPPEAIEARSDVYSLAVVLWELSSGGLPFPTPGAPVPREELSTILGRLAHERRDVAPQRPPGDRRLRDVLSRALAAAPEGRYASASEFVESLAGLREQRSALRAFPPPDRITGWAWRNPVLALIVGGLAPQLVGSALQISYNALRIVDNLTPAQKGFFPVVCLVYNVIAYPACLAWLALRLVRVVRVWNALRRGDAIPEAEVDQARRRALRLPWDTAIAATVGWLPGALIFPAALDMGTDHVSLDVWTHFIISFVLAWLIAVTYSFFFALGIVLRTMYLRFRATPRKFRERATEELATVPDLLRLANVFAGIIPLAAAVLLVLTVQGISGGEYKAFQFLTVALIAAGIAGFTVLGRRTRRYLEVVDACTGGEPLRLWKRRKSEARPA